MFLTIDTTSVAKAWAMALQRVFFEGDVIKSEYDAGNDFPTRDSTSAIHVSAPLCDNGRQLGSQLRPRRGPSVVAARPIEVGDDESAGGLPENDPDTSHLRIAEPALQFIDRRALCL